MPSIYQEEAIDLGLTSNQLQGHDWTSTYRNYYCGYETLKYLKNRSDDLTVQQAMDDIRGLNGNEIQAVALGLTRDQLQDHDWINNYLNGDCPDEILKYLRNRPDDVTAKQAMDNIRGLNGNEIQDIINFQNRAIEELGLTPTQVYIRRFDKDNFNAINGGQKYKDVMPEAFAEICNMAPEKDYTIGAVSAALSEVIPKEVGMHVGTFVSRSDGAKVAQTSRKAKNWAEDMKKERDEKKDTSYNDKGR